MSNTINLLPVRTRDQIRNEVKKFHYDFVTALVFMGFVVGGIILIFVNAFFTYSINSVNSNISTAKETLGTYKNLALGYTVVDRKVKQANFINLNKINPSDVIDYINSLLPGGSIVSNIGISSDGSFSMDVQNSNYVSVAKFLLTLENPKLKLKNTEIKSINFDHTQNIIMFQIIGSYIKNG